MSTEATAEATDASELNRAWRLHPQLAVRPEPFGALLYHFGTRTLSFLKDRRLLEVVQALEHSATAADACASAGVTEAELPRFAAAIRGLAASSMILERT